MFQILQRDPQSLLSFDIYTHLMMYRYYSQHNWQHWQLSPSQDMLAILFWGPPSLIDNIRIAMLMEAVRLGPQHYCIYFDDTLEFYSMFKLILYSLPQEKMFLYPTGTTLGGPFLH